MKQNEKAWIESQKRQGRAMRVEKRRIKQFRKENPLVVKYFFGAEPLTDDEKAVVNKALSDELGDDCTVEVR